MSISREQFDQIMERAMANRNVQRALNQARDAAGCSASVSRPVFERMDAVLDREVRNAAQALHINMTAREGDRIEHLIKDMSLEDAGVNGCHAPRGNNNSRGRN